jgi:hypothetical protein
MIEDPHLCARNTCIDPQIGTFHQKNFRQKGKKILINLETVFWCKATILFNTCSKLTLEIKNIK